MKKPLLLFLVSLFMSCVETNPNQEVEDRVYAENTIEQPKDAKFDYANGNEVYVPIYSDIYSETRDSRIYLTATLSIRNTSKNDTLFVQNVDYYDTQGELVRKYINDPIFLRPLETIDYVIEEEDVLGGSGANFLITWGANAQIRPLFQAVMLGMRGQHGFSFVTNGVPTK